MKVWPPHAGRRLARPAAVFLFWLALSSPAGAAPPPFGGLTPAPGCVNGEPSGGLCATPHGVAMDGYPQMSMSPDGRNLYAASDDLGPGVGSVAVLALDPSTGALSQPAGTAGCVSEDGSGGCADGRGLARAEGTAVSPDGKNVYVASGETSPAHGELAIFARDAASGTLTQLAGTAGCVSSDGSGGACATGSGLVGGRALVVSPDGRNVYSASSVDDAVAAFSRDPATGALTQLPDAAGCLSSKMIPVCGFAASLAGARALAISPDGLSLYVAAEDADAVAVFSRDPATGALTQLSGTSGCVSDNGSGGECADGTALQRPRGLAVSPDGTDVYVAADSSGAVTGFQRDAATGALSQISAPGGCVSKDGTGGACTVGAALENTNGVAVSPDGRSVYVASIDPTSAVTIFARDAGAGTLSQLLGHAGCVSADGTEGSCATFAPIRAATWPLVSPDGRFVTVSAGTSAFVSFARELPPGAAIVVGAPPLVADTVAPVISRVSISPRKFAATGRAARVRRSATVRYTLSEAARVSFTFQRAERGRRSHGKCRPLGRHRHAGRRCTRYVKVGRLSHAGAAGTNRMKLSGKLGRKRLRPGTYRLVLLAVDASSNRSKPRTASFRIVSAKPG